MLGKDFRDQITDTVKVQKHSKELLFNVFQQQRTSKLFSKAPRKVSFIVGGEALAASEEVMIPVSEEGSTATTKRRSKT